MSDKVVLHVQEKNLIHIMLFSIRNTDILVFVLNMLLLFVLWNSGENWIIKIQFEAQRLFVFVFTINWRDTQQLIHIFASLSNAANIF